MTSTIKVNTIQDSCGSALVTKCGSTITIGASGKNILLACGANQTGFGRSGSVDWCTTAKTSPFTGVSGKGYFINTTGGAVTVTLPSSPTAGAIISVKDYANTFDTNNLTIGRGGSKLAGACLDATLDTKGDSLTLVYVDATQGWLNVQTDDTVIGAPTYIVASGGTVTTSGDFKIHTFNSDATFTVCTAPTPSNNNVSYLVVAGGGGSGSSGGNSAGGGGAGGFREGKTPATPYTSSPLVGPAGLPVSVTSYPITVGAGGGGAPGNPGPAPETAGTQGSTSTFSSISSAGGGGGGGPNASSGVGGNGGSGGGGAGGGHNRSGGTGNTPPVSPPQGNNGGTTSPSGSPDANGGGGGGAGAVGGNASAPSSGNGGNGVSTEITGSAVTRAGGGAGGAYTPNGASMGTAGSGGGGGTNSNAAGDNGTANTGGGAGAPSSLNSATGATGGSGVVIIRYKFQ
jgi:hypothetical protein